MENNMDRITLVTCFFDINRERWSGFERGADRYIEEFEWWSAMKNKLVVYVGNDEIALRVKKIREKHNLLENTTCIVVPDIFEVDKELYNSIKFVSEYKYIEKYRLKPENPESWSAEYNYIMLMKEWCIVDAIKKGYANGMIAWIDFGFNKCGAFYTQKEEFSFEWKFPFSDKINIFALRTMEDIPPIWEIVRNMSTYLQGGIIVGTDTKWELLWNLMRKKMLALNSVGLMDDDQTILLMAWMENRDLFEINYCDWFMQFKKFGAEHLTVRETTELSSIKKMYVDMMQEKNKRKLITKYLKNQKDMLINQWGD